mgnify:CR=1 FL=1|tara:strand:- start:853 stop:1137 length:285 start_codon:yes stop_codon:yes gene_type:complete
MKKNNTPRIEIRYCTKCRFILRANWLAQELLMTFNDKIGELALIPTSNGEFTIFCDGIEIFSRKTEGKFPESKELKQLIRDKIAPDYKLGHSDE